MFYIKLETDQGDLNLVITQRETIYRGDNLNQKIRYLIPLTVGDIDMLTAFVYLNYIRADGTPDIVRLDRLEEKYNESYYEYTFPVTCKLTKYPGEICTWMQIFTGSMAINYFGEARMKQLLTLIKGQLDLKATPEQIAQAITDANLAQYAKAADLTDAVARIGENEADIVAIQKALESVATTEGLATLTADVNTIKGDYLKSADKTELQTAIADAVKAHDESDAAHAALFKALNDKDTAMQGEIDALEGKVGTVPADKTVVQMISEAQAAATYDDEEVRGLIQGNTDAIATLNGTGEGSVDKKITDAFNDFSTKVTDDAVVNSYKELIDWAATHGAEAAEMAGAITALENILAGIGGEGEHATVVAHVNAAIDALKIGDYAKASELTALAERVATMEAKVADWDDAVAKEHEHANKAVLDGITAEMVAAWNEADTEYTEAEVTAMWNEVFGA